MPKIVIADTSCLIVLSQIEELDLLEKLYTSIFITPEIKAEFKDELPPWVQVEAVADQQKQRILELDLDKGEASALALGMEQEDCLLIIDEKKGRAIAQRLGLKITGTLGVLIKGKEKGFVSSIKAILEKLEQHHFWLSPALKQKILQRVGET